MDEPWYLPSFRNPLAGYRLEEHTLQVAGFGGSNPRNRCLYTANKSHNSVFRKLWP